MSQNRHAEPSPRQGVLKLRATKRQLDDVELSLSTNAGRSRVPSTEQLVTVYFDTPHHLLRRRGLSLSLRKVRNTWRQVVSLESDSRDDLNQAIEAECAVKSSSPDVK